MTQLTEIQRLQLVALGNALRPLQADLSLSQLLALFAIAAEPGLSVNDLAGRLGIPQQTASRHIAGLLGRYQLAADAADSASKMNPLIRQEINSEDPRRRALSLSEDGQKLLEEFVSNLEPVSASPQRPRR